MTYEYDEDKFCEALLYVAKGLMEDPTGGATKVNKVLYFAEFAHMREHGRPITGADYQKLSWGPAPRRLLPVRDRLVAAGELEVRDETYLGYRQKRMVPLRDPNNSALTPSERKALDDALTELRRMSAKQASDLSHEELGWQAVDEGETIPYDSAILRRPQLTERIRERAAQLAAELAQR